LRLAQQWLLVTANSGGRYFEQRSLLQVGSCTKAASAAAFGPFPFAFSPLGFSAIG
jgi:hypothetical protein